jgi:hypothetical protein
MGGGAAKTGCRVTATAPALTGLGWSDGYGALRPIRASTFTGLWCRSPLSANELSEHADAGADPVREI